MVSWACKRRSSPARLSWALSRSKEYRLSESTSQTAESPLQPSWRRPNGDCAQRIEKLRLGRAAFNEFSALPSGGIRLSFLGHRRVGMAQVASLRQRRLRAAYLSPPDGVIGGETVASVDSPESVTNVAATRKPMFPRAALGVATCRDADRAYHGGYPQLISRWIRFSPVFGPLRSMANSSR